VALDEGPPVATHSAAAQFGVDALEGVRVEFADGDGAERGPDVTLDVVDVPVAGVVLDLAGA
jgi:hypothetical protein